MDEPTLGIDPSGVREFLALIQKLSRQQGLTVLLSSHHLHQVQQVCDRVGIFVSGKLVVEGNVGTLSRNLFDGRSYEVQVTVSKDLGEPWKDAAQLLELQYVEKVAVTGQRATILCSKDVTPDLVRFFVAKEYDVTGVHRKEYDLDDIYQKYFETDLNESSQ